LGVIIGLMMASTFLLGVVSPGGLWRRHDEQRGRLIPERRFSDYLGGCDR
jgi:hypothetical protein